MEKITKGKFIEVLTSNKTVFCGSAFRWDDEKIITGMERITAIPEQAERRTVTEKHTSYIMFSNGSRLDFNQCGEKSYFSHTNNSGLNFVLQKTEVYDEFDEETIQNYIVYAIV